SSAVGSMMSLGRKGGGPGCAARGAYPHCPDSTGYLQPRCPPRPSGEKGRKSGEPDCPSPRRPAVVEPPPLVVRKEAGDATTPAPWDTRGPDGRPRPPPPPR